jgi:hypothetical protein
LRRRSRLFKATSPARLESRVTRTPRLRTVARISIASARKGLRALPICAHPSFAVPATEDRSVAKKFHVLCASVAKYFKIYLRVRFDKTDFLRRFVAPGTPPKPESPKVVWIAFNFALPVFDSGTVNSRRARFHCHRRGGVFAGFNPDRLSRCAGEGD